MWVPGVEGQREGQVVWEEVWQGENCYWHKRGIAWIIHFLSGFDKCLTNTVFNFLTLDISLFRYALFDENFRRDTVNLQNDKSVGDDSHNLRGQKQSSCTATLLCGFRWGFWRLWSFWKDYMRQKILMLSAIKYWQWICSLLIQSFKLRCRGSVDRTINKTNYRACFLTVGGEEEWKDTDEY